MKVQLKTIKKRLLGGNPVISRLSVLFNKSLIHILKGQSSKLKECTELQKDSVQKAEKKSLLAKKRQ